MGTMEQKLERDLAEARIRNQSRKCDNKCAATNCDTRLGQPCTEKTPVNHWLQLFPWISYEPFMASTKPVMPNNWKKS